jgi:hypothetical protein
MFWSYGRRILAGARAAGRLERTHLIYITNFKCGPDSYIKHFVRSAFGRPFLTLQFDGHANDAGMLTRVEAFLDSLGILRRWAGRPAPVRDDEPGDFDASLPPVMPSASACESCCAGCASAFLLEPLDADVPTE